MVGYEVEGRVWASISVMLKPVCKTNGGECRSIHRSDICHDRQDHISFYHFTYWSLSSAYLSGLSAQLDVRLLVDIAEFELATEP